MYARLQLIGPSLVFFVAVAAEAAARALAAHPSSELLWYVNLAWFGFFERTYEALPQFLCVPGSMVWLAVPPLVIAWGGYLVRKKLLLAIGSNLSLIYAMILGYRSLSIEYLPQTASLQFVHLPSGPNFALVLVLCIAAFISFAISHIVYMKTILQRA